MPASNATPAWGTLLQYYSGGNWLSIAEVRSIGFPSIEREMIEVTNLTSPGAAKEFIGAFVDGAETPLELNYLPEDATHQAMLTNLAQTNLTLAKNQYRIVFTTGDQIQFSGQFKSAKITGSTTTALTANSTIKVTGPVTFT